MRILFVNSGLGLGGAERQVVLLARELVRQGHSAFIYGLSRETARVPELQGTRVEWFLDQKRRSLDPAVVLRLRRHIARWQPDVVQGILYDANIYSRLATLGTGLPVLGSERSDSYAVTRLQRAGYWLTARWCSGVVANSHAGARFASEIQGIDPRLIHVVWNGIDLAEVDARLRASNAPCRAIWPEDGLLRVCMVGAIKPAKDYPLGLQTMRCLIDRDPRWRFVCVGDSLTESMSREKPRVQAELERLALQPYVRFVGRRDDALEIIGSSDALLISSAREGFPNVVLEAMACGTPVASTEYSDVRRIVPNDWQVVAERRPEALADAIERCVAHRHEVVASQRAWVESHATIAASAAALLDVYRGCTRPAGHTPEHAT